jgi:hypothetical protein
LRAGRKFASSTKAEIVALPEGRTEVSLENIRQFILELDERDYMLRDRDCNIIPPAEGCDNDFHGYLNAFT